MPNLNNTMLGIAGTVIFGLAATAVGTATSDHFQVKSNVQQLASLESSETGQDKEIEQLHEQLHLLKRELEDKGIISAGGDPPRKY